MHLYLVVIILGILLGIIGGAAASYVYATRVYQKRLRKQTNTQRSVIKGQLAEQLYPLNGKCPFLPSDMRFIGNPIDYVVFNGYTTSKDGECRVEEVIFLEVKTGSARLSAPQRAIRDAINSGRVRWETIHADQ